MECVSIVVVPQATQLRLNAELDAGALAAISDMESFLRAPPARPTATKKTIGGASGSNNNNNNRMSPIQAVVNVSTHTAMGGAGRGRGTGATASASSPPFPASDSAVAVSRALGGGLWDTTNSRSTTNNKSNNGIGEDDKGDDQFHRVAQQARGQQRGSTAAAATAGGVVGDATAPPSTLYRLSERVKEAARASGERALLKKVANGSNLSAGTGDYGNTSGNDHNASVNVMVGYTLGSRTLHS